MADTNNENKSVTAKDLLSRLSKKTTQTAESGAKTERENAAQFIEHRLQNMSRQSASAEEEQKAEPAAGEAVPDTEGVYYDDEPVNYGAYETAADEEPSYDDGAEYESDEVNDDIYPDTFDGEEYVEEEADYGLDDGEYVGDDMYGGEYIPDGNAADPAMYGSQDNFVDGGETYDGGEEYADSEADDDMFEDIIPEDDFFDNDPIHNYEYDDIDESYDDDGEEMDEERAFEHLVAEVNADTGSSDELDESDINLMVALGMEDELAKSVGAETAAQMTDDYVADQEEWVDRTKRFGAGEYSDFSENSDIADKYRKRNRWAFWRMIASFVVTAALLVFENLPVAGYQLSGALDPAVYPVVYIMADLQLLFIAAALALPQLGRGFADLIRLKPSVYTVPAVAALAATVTAVYTAYTCVPGVEPILFNFPVALTLMFASISEYLSVRREIFSFNIVSSQKPKFVMRRLSTRDSVMESEALSELDSADFDEGDVIKIQKTDFVDGYFWRTKNRSGVNRSYVGLALVIALALSVAVGIYAGLTKSVNASALGAAFATFSASLPASMVIIGCYPFYRANRQAYENDSTIIGEASVEEYSGIGVISFDDVNVFPSYGVKVRNVRLYNNCRIDKVLYYAAGVFSATGGPLCDVFEVATMETGHADDVHIVETGSGYIEAEVHGKNVMFGSAEALSALGIIIPDEVVGDGTEIPMDCSVMYMIYQRKLVAKMIVNYVIDPDFEFVLKQLTASGMCVCVKTFDPNIDEAMIYRHIKNGKYSLRVIKYKNTEEITKYAKRAEGGIVSRSSAKSLLHTVSSCDKILSAQKTGFVIGVLSAILSAVIMGVVTFAGAYGSLHSLYIALCQLFWLIPVLITTRLIVRSTVI